MRPLGPDLISRVAAQLPAARDPASGDGVVEMLGGQPAYLFWLRRDDNSLLAVVAVLTRPAASETESRSFSFAHSLLRPVPVCLRRELLAAYSIEELRASMTEMDEDLKLLLADATDANMAPDGSDELKGLLQRMVSHLNCTVAALIVPEKGIALVRGASDAKTDGQLIARAHRQLVLIGTTNTQSVILNDPHAGPLAPVVACRALICPRSQWRWPRHGRACLAARSAGARISAARCAGREILARRAAVVVASHYDALSGLYTRGAFEQRVRSIVADRTITSAPWSALYVNCDRLHVINDNHGMHVGDTVIGQLGELIRSRLPHGALRARISGDRFTVLLPTEVEDASRFAESLRLGAEMLSALHPGKNISISISAGVAPLENGRGGELRIRWAAAKPPARQPRIAVAIVLRPTRSPTRASFAGSRTSTWWRGCARRLRTIACGWTHSPSCPQGIRAEAAHFELLLRMIDRDGSALSPDTFLSAAVRYQMMAEIDRWVVKRAIALLQGPMPSNCSPGRWCSR